MADHKERPPINPEAQAELNRICEKSESELTDYDKEFLWGRRDYLGARSKAKFQKTLDELAKKAAAKDKEDKKKAKKGIVDEPPADEWNGQPDPTVTPPADDEDGEDENTDDEDDDGEEEQG